MLQLIYRKQRICIYIFLKIIYPWIEIDFDLRENDLEINHISMAIKLACSIVSFHLLIVFFLK